MPETIYFIDPSTEDKIYLTYESRAYPYFVSDDEVYSMMYSAEENDWVITEDSEIKYRWKTNWPATGIIKW